MRDALPHLIVAAANKRNLPHVSLKRQGKLGEKEELKNNTGRPGGLRCQVGR
jgi:hypothetical protein